MKYTFVGFVVLIIAGLVLQPAFGQQAYKAEQKAISAGYGFGLLGDPFFSTYSYEQNYSRSVNGPVFAKFEYALSDHIALGVNFAYALWEWHYDDVNYYAGYQTTTQQRYTYKTMSFLARFNYHFIRLKKFDPYLGAAFGYRTGELRKGGSRVANFDSYLWTSDFPFGFETTVGARLYLTDGFAIYTETGMAKAAWQIGATVKF